MGTTHPTTPTGLTVDEGEDFISFQLPAWLSHDEVGELQRLANVHLAGILAAHRVAAAVRAKLGSGDAQPGGIDARLIWIRAFDGLPSAELDQLAELMIEEALPLSRRIWQQFADRLRAVEVEGAVR